MMWLRRLLFPLACAFMFASISLAQTPPTNPNERSVDVTGHGDANAKPDTLIISFAVDNQAPTADQCTREHAEKVRKIIDALKDKLGADTKIETTDYSLNPNIAYVNASAPVSPEPLKATWNFRAEVTAASDSLESMGTLIDSAMAAGATSLQQSGVGEFPVEEEPTPYAFFGGRKRRHEMKRMAYVVLTIETQGVSAGDASSKGSPRVALVQKVLKDKLGDHGTVKLTEFNIVQLNNQGQRFMPQVQQQPQQQIQNYAAHTTVTAETSKLDLVGPAVLVGIDSGATRLNQVQFTLHNDTDARKEAIEKASEEAKSKAESVAKSMGVKLGKIERISTNGAVRPQTIFGSTYQAVFAASALHRMESAPVPVLPREVGFSADVSVSYEIE
jgi:uncharacterized protein YggE